METITETFFVYPSTSESDINHMFQQAERNIIARDGNTSDIKIDYFGQTYSPYTYVNNMAAHELSEIKGRVSVTMYCELNK